MSEHRCLLMGGPADGHYVVITDDYPVWNVPERRLPLLDFVGAYHAFDPAKSVLKVSQYIRTGPRVFLHESEH